MHFLKIIFDFDEFLFSLYNLNRNFLPIRSNGEFILKGLACSPSALIICIF
jgi:hypothetical protein